MQPLALPRAGRDRLTSRAPESRVLETAGALGVAAIASGTFTRRDLAHVVDAMPARIMVTLAHELVDAAVGARRQRQ
jgi:hypothetical protein